MTSAEKKENARAFFETFSKSNPQNAKVKYSFAYTWTNTMIEKLQTDKFYTDDPIRVNPNTDFTYEEFTAYLMHTIWLTDSNTLTRWFEWSMLIRTYTNLKPFDSDEYNVVAKEIPAKDLCDDCEMSVTHAGVIEFVEERDTSKADWRDNKVLPLGAGICDFDKPRDGLTFVSLQDVCFRIYLADRTSLRIFILEKLTFGYGSNGDITD